MECPWFRKDLAVQEQGSVVMSPEFLERSTEVREAGAARGMFANLLPDGRVQVTGSGARSLVVLGARPTLFRGALFETEDSFWAAMKKTPMRYYERA